MAVFFRVTPFSLVHKQMLATVHWLLIASVTEILCLCHLQLHLGAFAKLRKATISFVILSVRLSAWNNSAPTGRIFMKFGI